MKRVFLKNMIATCLITSTVANVNMVQAHAAWSRNYQNNWTWKENGEEVIGWKNIQGIWYYFDDDGEMVTGWAKVSGNWYYFNSSGAMVTGWMKDSNGDWYYLSGSGAMATGWMKDYSGDWYYLSGSGTMTKGWIKSYDGNWYYLKNSGQMATGWIEDKGEKYYFQSDGAMATGKKTIDGKTYEFNSSGNLVKSESIENSSSFVKEENRIAYIATDSCPLNLRDEPSTKSNIIGSIPKGMQVVVIGKEVNGFYKVEWDNTIGYISSSWVSFEKKDNYTSNSTSNLISNSKVELGQMRTTAPSRDSKYYYSDSNLFYKVKLSPPFLKSNGQPIVGNCTWYTWGRIWELTGKMPTDADFRGNAYEWWEANKRTGKYKYGSTPKVGAVPVWKSSLPNSGGCGHVAVVEKIENGKVYISESSWHGSLFNYREIYNTDHLYGYIYIDEPNY